MRTDPEQSPSQPMSKAEAGRLGGRAAADRHHRERNGRWLGDISCTACGEPASYKTTRLCRRCRDRERHTGGLVVGPLEPWRWWWIRLGRPAVCVIPSCGQPHKGVGLCQRHLSREYRNGHPLWSAKYLFSTGAPSRPSAGVWDRDTVLTPVEPAPYSGGFTRDTELSGRKTVT